MNFSANVAAHSKDQDPMADVLLDGALHILLSFDVSEEIDLEALHQILQPSSRRTSAPGGKGATTDASVHFSHPPVQLSLADVWNIPIEGCEKTDVVARYYSFGVIVMEVVSSFQADWNGLGRRAAELEDCCSLHETALRDLVGQLVRRAGKSVLRPTLGGLTEKYLIVNVRSIRDGSRKITSAAELKQVYGNSIAGLLRGETQPLAEDEVREVMSTSSSYYETDLTVVTSSAAFIFDRPNDAEVETQVLEYAKLQLLEFRYYDALLARVLDDVYKALGKRRNIVFERWTLPREANRFNRIRVDTMDLMERVDSAVKFVNDIFYARVYRLAAERMGIPEYRSVADEKVRTLGELYMFMVEQFNETRTFVLEIIAAVLALVDILFLLRWH